MDIRVDMALLCFLFRCDSCCSGLMNAHRIRLAIKAQDFSILMEKPRIKIKTIIRDWCK